MSIYLAKNQNFSFPYHHNMDSRKAHSDFIASLCPSVNSVLLSEANPVLQGEEEPELLTLTKALLWKTGKLNRVGVQLMVARSEPPTLEVKVHGLLLNEIESEFVRPVLLRMKISLELQEKDSEESSFSVNSEQESAGGMCCFQTPLTSEQIEKLKSDCNYRGTLSIELIPVEHPLGIAGDDADDVILAPQSITAAYKRMLEEKICCDIKIIAKDGSGIKCHKAILALHIPVFPLSTTFSNELLFEEEDEQTNRVQDPYASVSLNLSKEGVNALLKFIYYFNVDDMRTNQQVAVELLEFANKNGMAELANFLKNLFMNRIDAWDVDLALTLFSGANGDVELEKKAFQIIKAKPYEQLSNSPVYKEIFVTKPETAMKLFGYFLESNN